MFSMNMEDLAKAFVLKHHLIASQHSDLSFITSAFLPEQIKEKARKKSTSSTPNIKPRINNAKVKIHSKYIKKIQGFVIFLISTFVSV